jgi:predicted dehydrogenase
VLEPGREPLAVAVIGAGYWGPNLIRNFLSHDDTDLRWVCDLDEDRAARVAGPRSGVSTTANVADVVGDAAVDAVAIATPPGTHHDLGLAAIEAGKHVIIEKPLARSSFEAEALIKAAESAGVVLMCDHTYCYTESVKHIRHLVQSGGLGDIQFIDSVRVNLGLVQSDTDVFWDLAPHDISIIDFILPQELRPVSVAAVGSDPIGAGQSCVGYLTLALGGGAIAHVHLNWLSPLKIRTMIVGGSRKNLVWDDLDPTQPVSLYDRGVEVEAPDADVARRIRISYRTGDMVAPALPQVEALRNVVTEFTTAIREGRDALTSGRSGQRVLRVLEAARISLAEGGRFVDLDEQS